MKHSDLISGIFWLIFGLLLSLWATNYQIGSLTQPGPGFLPLVVGVLLILFSFILLGQGKKSSLLKEGLLSSFLSREWKKVAYTVLIMLLATFLFEKIGYLLTVFLLIVLLMMVGELQNWKKILLIALITALGIYIIFVRLLEQPLPRGFLRI